jgi:hypothetical protein
MGCFCGDHPLISSLVLFLRANEEEYGRRSALTFAGGGICTYTREGKEMW